MVLGIRHACRDLIGDSAPSGKEGIGNARIAASNNDCATQVGTGAPIPIVGDTISILVDLLQHGGLECACSAGCQEANRVKTVHELYVQCVCRGSEARSQT